MKKTIVNYSVEMVIAIINLKQLHAIFLYENKQAENTHPEHLLLLF